MTLRKKTQSVWKIEDNAIYCFQSFQRTNEKNNKRKKKRKEENKNAWVGWNTFMGRKHDLTNEATGNIFATRRRKQQGLSHEEKQNNNSNIITFHTKKKRERINKVIQWWIQTLL